MERRLRNRRRTVGLSIGLIAVVLAATLAVAGGMGAALPTLKDGGTYKEGSAFVVSFYDVVVEGGATVAGKKIQDVLMVKDKEATGTGGWIYAAFGPDGKPLQIDPVKACYECHEKGAKATDFVFSKYVD